LAAVAGGAAVLSRGNQVSVAQEGEFKPDNLETDLGVRTVYSVCLMCHSACGIKCRVKDGVLLKIDGNPFHPNGTTFNERVPFATDPFGTVSAPSGQGSDHNGVQVKRISSSLCAKGQAGIEHLYNPYRVKHPLKRAGSRGENRWITVSWDQALDEIADAMAVTGGGMRRWAVNANATYADFGPEPYQAVSYVGRMEHGDKELNDRFWKYAWKTPNKREDHTSICETSHHVAGELVGRKHMKPDILGSDYIILFGTSWLEAGFPMVALARKLMEFKNRANPGTLVVVDPRRSATATKADTWVGIKPGTDAAFGWGMIQRFFTQNSYDQGWLKATNDLSAANAPTSTSHGDACYLVRRDNGQYLTASDANLSATTNPVAQDDGAAGAATEVVSGTSNFTGYLFNGGDTPTANAPAVTVNGHDCDTVLQLVYNRAFSQTMDHWSAICTVPRATIESIADGYSAARPRCAVNFYRGAVQNTNGLRTALTLHYLNMLMGNVDRTGGLAKGGGHWHEMDGGGYDATLIGNTNDVASAPASPSGPRISRAGYFDTNSDYANFAIQAAEGYPARRPWFPMAKNGNWQEVLPSIDDGYPYACTAFFMYAADPLFTTPSAREVSERVLKDPAKVKLFVSIDIEVNETNVFADYILPDTTFLEKWSTPHISPAILTKVSHVRQPVVGKIWNGSGYTDIAEYFTGSAPVAQLVADLEAASAGGNYSWTANPYYVPYLPNTRTPEDIYCDLARRIGSRLGILGNVLPAFGPNAFPALGAPNGRTQLDTAWDWYLYMFANLADEGTPVPGATLNDRIAYLLERGGRFDDGDGYDTTDSTFLRSKINKFYHFYSSPMAAIVDTANGQALGDGLGDYVDPFQDWLGNPFDYSANYPLLTITYKPAWHTQSRTALCPTLMGLMPSNFVEMNTVDATARGVVTGDKVKVTSNSYPQGITGDALVNDNIAQGVIAVSASFGHWELHSRAPIIDGWLGGADPTRGAGINANPILDVDPSLGASSGARVCLQDKLGGSCSFFNTRVEVTKL
jgi:anaerobic selenocysteine-containing dehydrogenase